MAEVLFTASAIYKNGQYVFNDSQNVVSINAPKIDAYSPRQVWLLRYLVPGNNQVQYLLTFQPSSADLADTNTLTGLWVEQDGEGVMIDCISVDQFIAVANGTGTIQRRYGAAPAFTNPTAAWWCVTRADDGSGFAHSDVVMDYIGQYFGNVRLKTNTSGVSVYTFQAYGTVIAVGSDSVTTTC
jgi:hypothetical protein